MDNLLDDLRYAIRMLSRNSAFTVIAILTLALGIGANTALFSVVNGVLLNPLPFFEANQLVTFYESKPNFDKGSLSYPNFLDWRKENRTFDFMAVYREDGYNLTGLGDAEFVRGEMISAGLFSMLGVKPVIGRDFNREEDRIGTAPVVLISAGLWDRKFGSSPGALGRTLSLDGEAYTICGVIPASFHLPIQNFQDNDVYVPIGQSNSPRLRDRKLAWAIDGIGRLKHGVTIKQARADLDEVTRKLAAAYPDANKGVGATLVPLREEMVGRVEPILWVLLGAVAGVLLIACVNVANLLLARSTSRTREFAVRLALGASRGRIIRQLLTESVLLALAGGGAGLLLAAWGTQAALGLLPQSLPRVEQIGLDGRVLMFTAAITLLSGVFFGLAPALKTAQPDVHGTLKEGGRGASGARHRAQGIFVVIEMALALVLLIGAGLMTRSLGRLWGISPGFNPHNVMLFGAELPPSTAKQTPDEIRAALTRFNEKLESVPGVQAASLSWGATPMDGDDEQLFWLDGQPKPASDHDMNWSLSYVVMPRYLQVMGIPLRRGRFFTPQDDGHAPLVAVIDDVLARKFFPNQDPIGKRLNLVDHDRQAQIVGIAGHVKQWGLDLDDNNTLRAQMYLPLMQVRDSSMARMALGFRAMLRTSAPPLGLTGVVRRTVSQMNSEQVIYGVRSMDEIVSRSLAQRQFAMILLGIFAALALALSSIGLYGVVSYVAGQRTHEIGIRVALGAQRRDILRGVLSHGLKMTLVGLALGLAAALGLTRLMESMLFGVSTSDPVTILAVSAVLTGVAAAASYVPARRAMRVDPIIALRYE